MTFRKTSFRVVAVLTALVFASVFTAQATGQEVTAGERIERNKLYTGCTNLDIVVESLHSAARGIGLTEEAIQAAAESRLRSARIFTDSDEPFSPYLYVQIGVLDEGDAFNINLALHMPVENPYLRSLGPDDHGFGFFSTWDTGSFGVAGRSGSGFILQSLSRLLDKFIAAYLRVNEAAC